MSPKDNFMDSRCIITNILKYSILFGIIQPALDWKQLSKQKYPQRLNF